MTTANNSGDIVTVIASLSLLTPLVRALNKWQIDLRKTPKPEKKTPSPLYPDFSSHPKSTSHRQPISNFDRFVLVWCFLGIISSLGFILMLAFLVPPHPATSRDIAQVGLMLMCVLLSVNNINQILG